MTKLIFITTTIIFLLFIPSIPVLAESVTLENVTFTMSIDDGNTFSSHLTLSVNNAPTLPEGVKYRISFNTGDLLLDFGNEGLDVDLDENLVLIGGVINASVFFENQEEALFSRAYNPLQYNHVGHILANWTFGPPDNRGFGVGVRVDTRILTSTLPNNPNIIESKEFAELTLNLLLGNILDYDGDGVSVNPSDGFGMLLYMVGMRDHLFNTANGGAIEDANLPITTQSFILSDSFDTIIDDTGISNIQQNLNTSTTLSGKLVQSAFSVLENEDSSNVDNLFNLFKGNVTEFVDFTNLTYESFQALVMNGEFLIENFDFVYDLNDVSVPVSTNETAINESDFPIIAFFSLVILIPIIRKKFVQWDNPKP